MRSRRRGRAQLALALVIVLVAVAVQACRVHQQTGEWRLWPAAAPDLVHFRGRDYHRSGEQRADPDAARQGTTPGGGEIWATPVAGAVPTGLWVEDGDRTYGYALSGGP
jgi:hypothetical protein